MRKSKPGFTLAETLITLTIVGVIAAIAIPNLITKYQTQTYVVGLKKAYSTLTNSTAMLPASQGCSSDDFVCAGLFKDYDGNIYSSQKFMDTFTSQMKLSKKCNAYTKGCGPDEFYHSLSSSIKTKYTRFKDSPSVVTEDGMAIAVLSSLYSNKDFSNICLLVDVNNEKGPNREGRDIFTFIVTRRNYNGIPAGLVLPMGSKAYAKYQGTGGSYGGTWKNGNYPCLPKKTGSGSYCAGRVLEENAMNY